MKINLQDVMEIEDLLTDKKTQEDIYDNYLDIIDEVEKTGTESEIIKLYIAMDWALDRSENAEKQYEKVVNSCKHIKVDFGGGYQKCLLCETEDQEKLTKWFGNNKIPTIHVETFMKKYGKCFENAAREKAFTVIKDLFIDMLVEMDAKNEEIDKEKLLYNLAVETHGFTGPVKKFRSRKFS